MTTPAAIEKFVRATRPPWNAAKQAFDWYGMCAGLTYRTMLEMGGWMPDGAYGSAHLAYLATRIESTDPTKAPPGACHYWYYVGTASNGIRARWDHVTLDVLGGGTDTLSATSFAHEVWNKSAGLISVASQSSRAGMRYLGWSRTYGARNRLSIDVGGSPAGEEEDMQLTMEDALLVAKAVWDLSTVTRDVNGTLTPVPMRSEVAAAKTNTIELLARTSPVERDVDGKTVSVPMRQEWADAKTQGIRANEKLDALAKNAGIDYDALATAIVKAGGTTPSAAAIADAVADVLARRLTT